MAWLGRTDVIYVRANVRAVSMKVFFFKTSSWELAESLVVYHYFGMEEVKYQIWH